VDLFHGNRRGWGLSTVYFKLGGSSLPGVILTILTATFLVMSVFMAICADLSYRLKSNQGDEKKNEILFYPDTMSPDQPKKDIL
jgi:hypothetical protein